MTTSEAPKGELVLYQTDDGRTRVECRFEGDTIWLTQVQLAELFETSVHNINIHLKAVYEEGELDEGATIKSYLIVRAEGKRSVSRQVLHYSLPAVLAVGFRVRSHRGTQFQRALDVPASQIRSHLGRLTGAERRGQEPQRRGIQAIQGLRSQQRSTSCRRARAQPRRPRRQTPVDRDRPREALREAVLNALIHKDYSSGAPIQIRVYRDKLRISNAGELPPAWTVETLLKTHDSRPPNPDIANTFFRAGLIEAWGRGYEMIREACQEAGAPEPTVAIEGGFRIEWQWQVPNDAQAPQPGAGEVTTEVTTEVARLVAALSGEMTRRELQAALGLRNGEHFRKSYPLPALEAGAIEMTIPDKPNSRLQRYRITTAAKARRAAKSKGAK